MPAEELTFVFKFRRLSAEVALQGIRDVLAAHRVSLLDFELSGRRLTLDSNSPKKRGAFNIIGHGFEFLFGSLPSVRLDFLTIKRTKRPEWATHFIGKPDFLMAWVADSEYEYWQNAHDPLQYTSVGRSYAHLPMKSNGLPPPLEQAVIDTSCNPGRRILRTGYVEAVGAMMWLCESFWPLTGAGKNAVADTKWLLLTEPAPSVTKVQAADSPFVSNEGSSGQLQRKLRSLLFPGNECVKRESTRLESNSQCLCACPALPADALGVRVQHGR